jgi:alpha-beta hydrolase superfamily lysophospholipase
MEIRSEASAVEEATFPSADATLYRLSVRPSGEAWAHLGILHGYGDHSGRFRHFMEWMAARGIACHALDCRGHGRSTGRRGYVTRWDEYLDDLDLFLRTDPLRDEDRAGAPLFLLGHSHGGLVAASAGVRGSLPGVSGCVLTAPFLHARMAVPQAKILFGRLINPVLPWVRLPAGLRDEWMSSDEAMVRESRADPLIVRTATPRWYLGMLKAQEQARLRAGEFRLPLLIEMGEDDPVADPGAAREFYGKAGSADKTFHSYPGYLHEILREAGREAVFTHILEWLRERHV